jgi:hypothetical protein
MNSETNKAKQKQAWACPLAKLLFHFSKQITEHIGLFKLLFLDDLYAS